MDILINTSTDENKNYRISSLITIGYLGQEIEENLIFGVKKNLLLNSILKNIDIQNDEEIIKVALDAFKDFCAIISDNMKTKVMLERLNFL